MSLYNDYRIVDPIPLQPMIPTVWREENNSYIHHLVMPNNPKLEPSKGRIYREKSEYDILYTQPTGARDQAQELTGSRDSIEYETKSHRRKWFIDPIKAQKTATKSSLEKMTEQRQTGLKKVIRSCRSLMEKTMADTFTSAANFTQTATGIAWSSLATATPFADIMSQADTLSNERGVKPADISIIFGYGAYRNITSNSALLKQIGLRTDQAMGQQKLVDLMQTSIIEGIGKVFVAAESINTANPGQAENRQRLWQSNLVWIGVLDLEPSSSDMYSATYAKYNTFGEGIDGSENYIDIYEYYVPGQHKDSRWIEGEVDFDMGVLDTKLGRSLLT
jgi:hypothetical protein